MDLEIKGKVIIVTGGSAGVGKAIVIKLTGEDAKIAIVDIDKENGLKLEKKINTSNKRAVFIHADITKKDDIEKVIGITLETFGRIDILINNAGIIGKQGPWHLLDDASFDKVVSVNFKAIFSLIKEVVPVMIRQENGKIIMVSSIAANKGEQYNGIYSATKAAVKNMTESLAAELGRYNITVNAIGPAAMDTALMAKINRERAEYLGLKPEELEARIKRRFKLKGGLSVEDTADIALFLSSRLSNKLTGQIIYITAGVELG
jgi:NAD(P)-dependent dehydrogenase (short-subunit alcohol dehydrogenase family)